MFKTERGSNNKYSKFIASPKKHKRVTKNK